MGRGELERVESVLAEAKRLRRAKHYDEASRILLAELDHGVEADKVFFQLGNVFFDAGDLTRAEYSYRRATEVNPQYASAHYNLGVVYKRQKKIAASIGAQRKAMMLELQGKGKNPPALSREASRWARKIGHRGLIALGLLAALFIGLVYLL